METHKYNIMDDLGVKTTAELVQHAIKHGLIAGWSKGSYVDLRISADASFPA